MGYELIDEQILSWARDNNLKLFTQDRDWEVRSFRVSEPATNGRNFQIWIEAPVDKLSVVVNLKDYASDSPVQRFSCPCQELIRTLDEVLRIALAS